MSNTLEILNVLNELCYHDPRNPNCYDHLLDEEDRQEPRGDCGCDNCFYGRDRLALEILRLQGIIATLANEGRDALSKLARYDMAVDDPGCECCGPSVMHDRDDKYGDWVKYADVVALLSPTPSPEGRT